MPYRPEKLLIDIAKIAQQSLQIGAHVQAIAAKDSDIVYRQAHARTGDLEALEVWSQP